jgi:hypothetical protein
MPRIIVVAEESQRPVGSRLLDEHIVRENMESEHFATQLMERVRWALEDADVRAAGRRVEEAAPSAR